MATRNGDEVSELVKRLDSDLKEFVAQLKPKKYEEGWPEDKWEQEIEKHPLFMSKPAEGDLHPAVEALQQLKYDSDENTPEELANSYREDGNQNFKVKKFQWAVDSYTQGLQCKCKDDELNAQLYSNRAAAFFHLGSYQNALEDATKAKLLKPRYMKAIQRGAECCLNLNKFEDCFAWCEEGLKVEPENSKLEDIKEKAIKAKKIAERDRRKAKVMEVRRKKESEAVLKYIKEQGINFDKSSINLDTLEPSYSILANYKVHFDGNGSLVWPVVFLYPEYQAADSIQQFHEDSSFQEQLCAVFTDEASPPWDKEQKYKLDALQVYFGHYDDEKLIEVKPDATLKTVLHDSRYKVFDGVPSFFITVKNSEFDKMFRKQNGMAT